MEGAEHGRAVEVAREVAPGRRPGVELAGEAEEDAALHVEGDVAGDGGKALVLRVDIIEGSSAERRAGRGVVGIEGDKVCDLGTGCIL